MTILTRKFNKIFTENEEVITELQLKNEKQMKHKRKKCWYWEKETGIIAKEARSKASF